MPESGKKISKATRNYYYNLFSLIPFLFLLFTGIVVLRYHSGTARETLTFGYNGQKWLEIHRIMMFIIIPVIGIHLWMHAHWLKNLVTLSLKGKNSGLNLTLFIVFLMCAVTAILGWTVLNGTPLGEVLVEVHSKLGLLLIFFFIIHMSNYFKWLVNMTRKHFGKK